ncbi:MAG TPA: stage II sporulation protein M, partial [Candidatus Eremiobacteraceae bacterium]
MTQRSFVEKRREGWARLEELIAAVQRRGLRRLEAEQVAELGRLYRWVTSDLAYADGHRFDPALRAYLNRLTARAHAYVYGGGIERGRARFLRFYTTVFPCEVRNSGGYILACAALFALTAVLAYWLVVVKPQDIYALLPAQLIEPIHKSLHDSNFAFDRDYAATMSAAIIANNIRVASMCFAGGMTLGIFTIYELVLTGFMVGGLGALFANAGFGLDYF